MTELITARRTQNLVAELAMYDSGQVDIHGLQIGRKRLPTLDF